MSMTLRYAFAAALLTFSSGAMAAELTVTVEGIEANRPIAEKYALCKTTADGKSAPGANQRPTISWVGTPAGTASIAVFMMDPDVPADFTDAGKDGKIVAASAPRQDFFHWGVIGIPASATTLVGDDAATVPDMGTELPNSLGAAKYVPTPGQFGGPCPPWNDARIHHYHFIVLALDKTAPVYDTTQSAKDTYARLITSPHVLAKGAVVGTYTLNPSLRSAN